MIDVEVSVLQIQKLNFNIKMRNYRCLDLENRGVASDMYFITNLKKKEATVNHGRASKMKINAKYQRLPMHTWNPQWYRLETVVSFLFVF